MDLRHSDETDPDLSPYHPGSVPKELQARKQEQEKLSGVVKSVHRKLRKKYIEGMLQLLSLAWINFCSLAWSEMRMFTR